ncbi:MAG: sugar ABC transporter permease [Proteobacteria bacterium]|jgi:arabinogalactan oligomer / maltooligosaccharide transport system permease protein|nr:sugar ABC transporter permease [Pseudomonadota bacterium]
MRHPSTARVVLTHIGIVLFTIATLYPVLWVIKMAVSPGQAFSMGAWPFPSGISTEHFEAVLFTLDENGNYLFFRQLLNSLVISVCTAVLGLVLSTLAAYGLSRWDFPGRDRAMSTFLVTQMFPGVVMAIPLYILLDSLHLLDSLTGLILVYSTTAVPFSVWTLKGYFDTIPRALEEAAFLDGASRLTTFFYIILPLARPALAVTGLFSFMAAWNEFILAATLMNDERSFTLPVVLQRYVHDYGTEWGSFAAGAILVSVPVMALFFALQRHFVEGLTAGSVKG